MDHFFKMLRLSNTPTAVPTGEDEVAEADEPPDDQVSNLTQAFTKANIYTKSSPGPQLLRRESLLTRAIMTGSETSSTQSRVPYPLRGLSTTSSHSFASTAELTSDDNSPIRSASPSPPPPTNRVPIVIPKTADPTAKVIIASISKDDKPDVAEVGEAAIEKTLGRKRCIMFACNNAPAEVKDPSPKATPPVHAEENVQSTPAPRKCRLTFACPTRKDSESDNGLFIQEKVEKPAVSRRTISFEPEPKPKQTTPKPQPDEKKLLAPPPASTLTADVKSPTSTIRTPLSPRHPFHEFASSHDETDEWVEQAAELNKPKLTLDDCLRKENAIRRIGKEAEEEAEAEEREQDELENEMDDDNDGEDDFAPSDGDDNDLSDGGNESDDEEGFAESDDEESENESEYQFWTHSSNNGPLNNDNITHFSARQSSRSRLSSVSSTHSESEMNKKSRPIGTNNRRLSKLALRMRPGTPELPDSTDFVCGTLDEDRPLEAAYISCREEKRRQKRILIPQDIDPSFPTTDPEDEDDDDVDVDDIADSSDHVWVKGQFEGFDSETRGRRKPLAFKRSPLHSPNPMVAPPRQPVQRNTSTTHMIHRSPPPPKQGRAKSPAPKGRLFDHPPKRLRSPPPTGRLRSPRGSPTGKFPPLGITINRLAQRPKTDQTSSLPHTPNPFFKNWRNGSPAVSRIASAAVSPGTDEVRPDLHVRGPVDIVIGLEKKRQKRKEKFWRQHCRKAAKGQTERRPAPGRGAERMKELGLECAERTRGYGLGQPAQLVLSL